MRARRPAGCTPCLAARRSPALLAAAWLALGALGSTGAVAAPAPAAAAAAATAVVGGPASSLRGDYERLRAQVKWVPMRVGSREVLTPDSRSRLLLARSAADHAGLAQVGLDFRDVYGVISAETSWFARDGLGRNGVTSEGLGAARAGKRRARSACATPTIRWRRSTRRPGC